MNQHATHDPRPDWHDCPECDRVRALEMTFGAFLTGYARVDEKTPDGSSYMDGYVTGSNTASRTLLELWRELGGLVPQDPDPGLAVLATCGAVSIQQWGDGEDAYSCTLAPDHEGDHEDHSSESPSIVSWSQDLPPVTVIPEDPQPEAVVAAAERWYDYLSFEQADVEVAVRTSIDLADAVKRYRALAAAVDAAEAER